MPGVNAWKLFKDKGSAAWTVNENPGYLASVTFQQFAGLEHFAAAGFAEKIIPLARNMLNRSAGTFPLFSVVTSCGNWLPTACTNSGPDGAEVLLLLWGV